MRLSPADYLVLFILVQAILVMFGMLLEGIRAEDESVEEAFFGPRPEVL